MDCIWLNSIPKPVYHVGKASLFMTYHYVFQRLNTPPLIMSFLFIPPKSVVKQLEQIWDPF